MRLNSKDLKYSKPSVPVEKPIEVKTEKLDDTALLSKIDTMLRRYTSTLQAAFKQYVDSIPEEKEETPKEYSCEIIRDNQFFITEVKIKEAK